MKSIEPEATVGVIIGRFQVPNLHAGHKELIYSILDRHKKVVVLLGSTPGVLVTRRQPMDFMTRKLMLEEEFHHRLIILPLQDMPDDQDWSEQVDSKIIETFGDHTSVNLYGSRDSFIPHYKGKFHTIALQDSVELSGTEIRKEVSDEVRQSEDFRKGVIYAAFNKHPTVFPTVDIVAFDSTKEKVALGRKRTDPEGKWRFPGGFLDPRQDSCLEDAALREAREEIGDMDFHSPFYLGSTIINDWRYRSEVDSIITSVFEVHARYGAIQAGDDLQEARWFKIDELNEDMICPGHQPILKMIKRKAVINK